MAPSHENTPTPPDDDQSASLAGPSEAGKELDDVFPAVYEELKRVAHRHLRGERTEHTLGTTALVHEAYLELAKLDNVRWPGRPYMLAAASKAMRRILIDYAVARRRAVGARRSARAPRRGQRTIRPRGRVPVLRRHERRGDGGGVRHVTGHGEARLDHGARVAQPRARRRMTGAPTERWRRIEELLAAALDREPAARERFLDAACAGDSDLRREVESLVAAHERSGALDRLAPEVASITAELRGATAMLAGRTIGHYQVIDRVGGGGMGVIYKAVDTRLGRSVALKFLKPRLDADASAAERFRQEARAAGALEHPNICTIYDIGETEDGQLFLAMPLYDGETLEQRIKRGPLAIGDATDIAVQMLRGLAKAHARGIIHRDIKPANVFITTDGVVKLIDFGIAKLADVSLTGPASRPLGTVAYMSPEQAHGTPVDHRTDLWSAGAVLYEMLSGRRPYPRGVPGATAEASASVPASLAGQRPDVTPALEQAVMKALERYPADRYSSADAFAESLIGSR